MYGNTLKGSNFLMRPHRVEEAGIYAGWFEDREVTRWLGNHFPPSVAHEKEWIEKRSTDPDTVGWTIEFEGRPVGVSDIAINRKTNIGVTGTVIGDKSAWGKGIGGESMILRRDFAFYHEGLRKLRSGYIAPNKASERAQLRAGYHEAGRYQGEFYCEGVYVDHVLTEILREDWEKLRQLS